MKLSLFFIYLLVPTFGFAEVCALSEKSNNHLLQLKSIAQQIEKTTQVNLAKENPTQFCEKNMKLRFLNVNPIDTSSVNFKCTEMNEQELDKYVNEVLFTQIVKKNQARAFQPWFYSLIQTDLSQNFSLLPRIFAKDISNVEDLEKYSDEMFNRKINSLQEKNFKNTPQLVFQYQPLDLDKIFKPREDSANLEDNFLIRSKICSDLNLKETLNCSKALKRAIEIGKPMYFADKAYMPLEVWKKIYKNEKKYLDGLQKVSNKILQNLQHKNQTKSNILDDLNEAFLASGLSKDDALDASYEILALYGNGGANLGARVFEIGRNSPDNPSSNCYQSDSNICILLDFIGKSIPILDYKNTKAGQPMYSLPQGVVGSCNTNKSYHFWAAAYLSRQLVKEGYDPQIASLATYAASVGYQINRDQGVNKGQVGVNALKKSTYDPVINIMRADLSYSYAGSQFGSATNSKKGNISIDKILVKFLEKSPETAMDYSKTDIKIFDQFQKYNRFKEIVVPDAPFDK